MKFVISTQELNYLINLCQSVVGQKSSIPVLSNILLECKGGSLTLTASDLKMSIRCVVDAKVLEEGKTTLPAKKFASLVRELTAMNVEVSTNANHVTEIVSGTSRFKLNGMSDEEFPELPDLRGAKRFSIAQSALKDMFYRTSFAVSKEDEQRPSLTGVNIRIEDRKARFIGTDGKRLAIAYCDVDVPADFTGDFVIPIKAVDEILKCVTDDGEATLFLTEEMVGLETENTLLITKLINEQYPNVVQIIPKKVANTFSLHRDELISLLRQVSLFTTEGNNTVRFTFQQGELKLSVNSMEVGEGKVNMPVNYSGEEMSIAFNPQYFIDVLKHSKGENVKMGITDSFSPGLITDSESGTTEFADASPLFVLMPMRLKGDV